MGSNHCTVDEMMMMLQVTKAVTSLLEGDKKYLAGAATSIADLLALSLVVTHKIGACPCKAIFTQY